MSVTFSDCDSPPPSRGSIRSASSRTSSTRKKGGLLSDPHDPEARIRELEEHCAEQEERIAQDALYLQQAAEAGRELVEENERLRDDIAELQQSLAQAEARSSDLGSPGSAAPSLLRATSVSNTSLTLERDLERARETIEDLQREMTRQENELGRVRDELEHATQAKRKTVLKRTNTQQVLEKIDEVKELTATSEDLKDEISHLTAEVADKKKIEAQLAEERAKRKDFEEKYREYEEAVQKLNRTLDKERKEFAEFLRNADMEKEAQQGTEQQLAQKSQAIETLNAEVGELKSQLTEAKDQVEELEVKLGWERDEHEHLEGRLAEEIAARKELEDDLDELDQQLQQKTEEAAGNLRKGEGTPKAASAAPRRTLTQRRSIWNFGAEEKDSLLSEILDQQQKSEEEEETEEDSDDETESESDHEVDSGYSEISSSRFGSRASLTFDSTPSSSRGGRTPGGKRKSVAAKKARDGELEREEHASKLQAALDAVERDRNKLQQENFVSARLVASLRERLQNKKETAEQQDAYGGQLQKDLGSLFKNVVSNAQKLLRDDEDPYDTATDGVSSDAFSPSDRRRARVASFDRAGARSATAVPLGRGRGGGSLSGQPPGGRPVRMEEAMRTYHQAVSKMSRATRRTRTVTMVAGGRGAGVDPGASTATPPSPRSAGDFSPRHFET